MGCGMSPITIRGCGSLLAAAEEGLFHVFLACEPQGSERTLLMATIAERLFLAQATLTPCILLAGLEGHTEWLFGSNATYQCIHVYSMRCKDIIVNMCSMR